MKLDGASSRELVKLLDGSRDRSEILEKLADFVVMETKAGKQGGKKSQSKSTNNVTRT